MRRITGHGQNQTHSKWVPSQNICLYLSDEHSLKFQDTGPPLSCCGSQTFRLALLLQNLLQRPQGNSTEGSHFQRALVLKGYYKDKNSGGILWPISDRCRSNFHSSWPLVFKADSHFLELLKLLPKTWLHLPVKAASSWMSWSIKTQKSWLSHFHAFETAAPISRQ